MWLSLSHDFQKSTQTYLKTKISYTNMSFCFVTFSPHDTVQQYMQGLLENFIEWTKDIPSAIVTSMGENLDHYHFHAVLQDSRRPDSLRRSYLTSLAKKFLKFSELKISNNKSKTAIIRIQFAPLKKTSTSKTIFRYMLKNASENGEIVKDDFDMETKVNEFIKVGDKELDQTTIVFPDMLPLLEALMTESRVADAVRGNGPSFGFNTVITELQKRGFHFHFIRKEQWASLHREFEFMYFGKEFNIEHVLTS